ncbi:hypothetical protein HWV62_28810 [Athelia sp. TMB]|nr:hypothetical protein HWV62_28810 [Athelia sp. TMB]
MAGKPALGTPVNWNRNFKFETAAVSGRQPTPSRFSMPTLVRLISTLFSLAYSLELVVSTPTSIPYNLVYVDKSGIHYVNNYTSVEKRGQPYYEPPHPLPHAPPHAPPPPGIDQIVKILLEEEAEIFCSAYLHIAPYAATQTEVAHKTKFKTLPTAFVTSTATTNLGTTTVTDGTTSTTIFTTTDATDTARPVTTTASTTDTVTATTTTATTYLYTDAPQRRHNIELDLPHWLPFPSQAVSSACGHIVHPKTKQVTRTTTATATVRPTATTYTTSTVPQQTASTLTTTTTTTTFHATATDTQTTTTTATTTTTVGAVATQCAAMQVVAGGGMTDSDPDASLTFYDDATADACCRRCFASACTIWFFLADGFGCYNVHSTTAQCPSSADAYVLFTGDGGLGGEGPCAGQVSYSG